MTAARARTSLRPGPSIAASPRPLPRFDSRRELDRTARRHAHRAWGRARFIWESRVVAYGVPLGIAAGVAGWRAGAPARAPSALCFAALFGLAIGATYLAAVAEWETIDAP